MSIAWPTGAITGTRSAACMYSTQQQSMTWMNMLIPVAHHGNAPEASQPTSLRQYGDMAIGQLGEAATGRENPAMHWRRLDSETFSR